jgi:hypothetical protein
MAIFVLTDVHVIVNGVVLSDRGNSVEVEDSREQVDVTAFGAVVKQYTKGLGDGKITIGFLQDFAAAKVHATLQPLIGSSTPINVELRPTSAGRSATNPAVLMSGLLFTYTPLGGNIGAPSTISATFANAGAAGITYPIA